MSGEILRKSTVFLVCVALLGLVIPGLFSPVQAAPAYQMTDFPTPTPGLDGRIIYTVQEGDTLWRIAAVTGVSLDELRRLNNLDADAVIRSGQVLLLGLVAPQQATAEPGAEQPPAQPGEVTPTPIMDASTICALLYLDVNGNAIREDTEIPLADGEVSVTERLGAFSNKGTTSFQDEPVCFEDIPSGEYIITMALPAGYNRTTELSLTIELAPGDTSFINFGAQPSSIAPTATPLVPGTGGGGSSPLLAVLGVAVILAGIGVGLWAGMRGRRSTHQERE